jgi:hypothetical protein
MNGNPYTGVVNIETAEGAVPLRFSWAALGALRHVIGKDWELRLYDAIAESDAETIAKVLELGSGKPAAWWMEQSPPFTPTMQALQTAIRFAYLGPEEPEKNPPMARQLATLWQRVSRLGRRPVGEPVNSGS